MEAMLWDSGVSFGCLVTWMLWGLAFTLIATTIMGVHPTVGLLGLGLSAAAAAMTIIRDNQRTRRVVRAMVHTRDDDVRRLR